MSPIVTFPAAGVPLRAGIGSLRPFAAVIERELLKLVRQRARLAAQMVRPLIWLLVIGAGIGALMGRQGIVAYAAFLVPGVIGMTLLFAAMLGALSTVYDKETGVMRLLVIAPIAHAWLIVAKALAAAVAALAQGILLLALLAALGYAGGGIAIGTLAAGMIATALVCAALGMLVATFSRTLENYAVMMNLVIFPVYFVSGSLYPVDVLPDYLRVLALANPFTYGVDILKHAFPAPAGTGFGRAEFSLPVDFAVCAVFTTAALAIACARFARGAACERLVHPRGAGRDR
jgi:ABC-2 type transport system permease protein